MGKEREREKGNLCINIVYRIQGGPMRWPVLYPHNNIEGLAAKTNLALFFNYFFQYNQNKNNLMV